jgi:EAL domain-containing protein (putative c-di-GMP-specific phosphodiesterase class I)
MLLPQAGSIFSPAVSPAMAATGIESAIENTLLDGNCFKAVSMPIYRLADEVIAGYEMLSRGPNGPYRMPVEFFQLSIEKDILTPVDLHCFTACLKGAESLDQHTSIHVNLFPTTLIETPVDILLSLFPTGQRPGRLVLELVEDHFNDNLDEILKRINWLRKFGIMLAIDDVGFGRSNLESLLLLEPDIIKIDRCYVTGSSKDPRKERLLRRLIRVARTLAADIVAEGIDCKEDLALLKELGVNLGQGTLWGELPIN